MEERSFHKEYVQVNCKFISYFRWRVEYRLSFWGGRKYGAEEIICTQSI